MEDGHPAAGGVPCAQRAGRFGIMVVSMGTEIERKFLVTDISVVLGVPGDTLRQGYLSREVGRTVRVRLSGDRAWVTVKGRSTGWRRSEWEWEIPTDDALGMLDLCDGPILDKTRYRIDYAGRTWEVDVFAGANAGLVMAEVELESEDAVVVLPPWVGLEVTDDPRYYNSSLAISPVHDWPEALATAGA
jgi:CYTH domain-containing protein